MKKKLFIETIDFMRKRHDATRSIDKLFSEEFSESIFWPYCRYETQMIKVLEDIMQDKGDWISYFIYDLDFGRKWKPGTVIEGDKDISLASSEDLWNLLITKKN